MYFVFLYWFMFCLLFLLLCCLFPILYKTTDHWHRVETQLQEIHKYHNVNMKYGLCVKAVLVSYTADGGGHRWLNGFY